MTIPSHSRPPIHTALTELTGWTLDRSASLPKSHRFTFGQRLDNLTLDALLLATRAVFAARAQKPALLHELNLLLEQLRVGASEAARRGLEVHAGHGIDFDSVSAIAAIPEVIELNIGHFLIGEAIFVGIDDVIARMRQLMNAARHL